MQIIRGDDQTIEIAFTDEDGVAINLTGCTIFFTVKSQDGISTDNDEDSVIQKTITSFTNPTSGIAELVLTNTETSIAPGLYVYDLQMKTSDGKIQSTVKDVFEVIQDVTKSKTLSEES